MQKDKIFRVDSQRLLDGINEAYREMLQEKMLHNQKIVTADENGNPLLVDAKDAYEKFFIGKH